MKKLLRYSLNTFLFIIFWSIQWYLLLTLLINIGCGPTVLIGDSTEPTVLDWFGGFIALFISYYLVKRINKSKLWTKLFSDAEITLDKTD